ncbi:MAG: hypothetical protein IKE63_04645 [Bacilli bacterium]|nr:hypothetical protein [Bacilli bacterium]
MSERLRTGLIIIGIYALFCLYLLFVSYRVEKLDNDSYTENNTSVEKTNNN